MTVSTKTHGVIDYATAGTLLAAPVLLRGAGARGRLALSVAGGGVLATSLLTDYELGLRRVIPMKAHLALDAATGAARWRFATYGERILGSPAVAAGAVYVGADDGFLYALDAATGRERWRAPYGGDPTVVDGVVYVGEHGLELAPEAAEWASVLDRFADAPGWPLERKPLTLSLHYRLAPDLAAAERLLRDVEGRARAAGLVARWGRKVLELRPPVAADKGTAIRALLAERGLTRALFAGDDTTDLDGFRALEGLELSARVAVALREAPGELAQLADVVVESPGELRALLATL